jgi:small subunit ribosomal protein S17
MAKKKLQGTVVSDKMQKTVVVEVETMKEHPKYKRRYKSHNRFKAHDQNQEYHVGDNVVIEETKPMSKDKNWIVIKKI